ncbi:MULTISPECIES: YdiU family protein [unclassified Saccharibacter]|uniref:protein adenylyltransferase SelO n=1 Tax=unclassified Saccharibacter TaxID=2648722 RepID=UPI0013239DAE|nr:MULTISPECIES: YdiU family protein [unclassified Saccharibacter]MXV36765.1 YdiU family protein [Saccharibacter sp. EH611]MXV58257.1 YdiU family protein [Saccharibacter sp. EH70]MXV65713.1 YdiU family protein [Saccharibacter sp. EH60]
MLLSRHYAQDLPEGLSAPLTPTAPAQPSLIALNEPLARSLGLDPDWLRSPEGIALLSSGTRPDGKPPVAMAYAGHQFGHFVPSLGDGRAMLVGELTTPDGTLYDLHLKGTGPTMFSRGGDGYCALGPALREYLVSDAMAALGIPTARALAVLSTGEHVERDGQARPGAVVARVAKSHIRVGTFQYAAAHGGLSTVRALADFTIKRLFPEINPHDPQRYLTMLAQTVQRQAALVARWMGVGFIHGVLNTDNCTLSGETLDYGPCAFLDTYDPLKSFSFVDQHGRYAYGRQPHITLWNLCRLAECLVPLIDTDEDRAIGQVQDALKEFDRLFHHEWLTTFRQKLGLATQHEDDVRLLEHFLSTMHQGDADFTQFFRALSGENPVLHDNYHAVRETLHHHHGHMDLCRTELLHRLEKETRSPQERHEAMIKTNPRIIPRNHRVEQAIAAAYSGDMAPFHHLHQALRHPFDEGDDGFDLPPTTEEQVTNTYCGT